MKAHEPGPKVPSITRYMLRDWQDETLAIGQVFRLEWQPLLLVVLVLLAVVAWFEPLPKQTLRMAKGQRGSGLEAVAERYREELARHGVTLELVPSGGAIDNLHMVSEGKVDIGLSQSGLPAPQGVYYLGSVAYQPLWLFHRGATHTDRHLPDFLRGKTVSVGIPGSGSQELSTRFLQEFAPADRQPLRPLHLNNLDTVAALREGRIDAAFLLASMSSANAQALISTPGVKLYDFAQADGVALRWGFAEAVTLPAGALALSPLNPPHDVRMIAVTMTLVVRHDLHPATQQLLLSISKGIASQSQDVLDRPRQFPRFVDLTLPRSPEAERFFSRGAPVLSDRLPYWLAYIVDSLWVGTLTLVAVVYPLMRWKPNFRQLLFKLQTQQLRAQLDTLNAQAGKDGAAVDAQAMAALELAIHALRVPSGGHEKHQQLLAGLDELKARLQPADQVRPTSGRPRRWRPFRASASGLPSRQRGARRSPRGPST